MCVAKQRLHAPSGLLLAVVAVLIAPLALGSPSPTTAAATSKWGPYCPTSAGDLHLEQWECNPPGGQGGGNGWTDYPSSPPWVYPRVYSIPLKGADAKFFRVCGLSHALSGRNLTRFSPRIKLDNVAVKAYVDHYGMRCADIEQRLLRNVTEIVATAVADVTPPCPKPVQYSLRIAVTDYKCSIGHTLMLTNYAKVACEAHGTPTFQLRVYFKDATQNKTHTLRLKAFKAGDANKTALRGVRFTTPRRGGRVLNGTLPGGSFHPELVGVWEYTVPGVEDAEGVHDIDVTLRLPQAAGLYGVEAQVLDSGRGCGPFTTPLAFAVGSDPEAPDRHLRVLPASQCDKFYARGPAFWAKGGRGWLMWDGIAGNAGFSPSPSEPAEDLMLCQPGCCSGRPACFKHDDPGWFAMGNFIDSTYEGVGCHADDGDFPATYVNPHGVLCSLGLPLNIARGMINGEDWAFKEHIPEDHDADYGDSRNDYSDYGYETEITGARYGFGVRKVMYRHLIANWLNYLASYRSAPRARPNEKLLRFAIRWLQWGENNVPWSEGALNFAVADRSEEWWLGAWNNCSWPKLCGSRTAAEAFLATQDPYVLPDVGFVNDATSELGTVSPEECGRCIAKQLDCYPGPAVMERPATEREMAGGAVLEGPEP